MEHLIALTPTDARDAINGHMLTHKRRSLAHVMLIMSPSCCGLISGLKIFSLNTIAKLLPYKFIYTKIEFFMKSKFAEWIIASSLLSNIRKIYEKNIQRWKLILLHFLHLLHLLLFKLIVMQNYFISLLSNFQVHN